MNAYEKVKCTREAGRATAKDYIDAIFEGFVEFHGDRRFSDDPALIGGVALLGDQPVTVLGIEKGHDVPEHIARNFGCVSPEGYRKALRLMKQAEKFSRPVVCIVDTQGANCGIGAEERGEGAAIAENLYEMMDLHTPVLTLMVGEGSSGGALALAVADEIWMFENAYFTVVSPEACASILYKDAARAPEAAEHLKLAAEDLIGMGIIERVIKEPADFSDPAACKTYMAGLKTDISKKLHLLSAKKTDLLLADRYEKYRKIGRCATEGAMPAPKRKRS
jgi:acetyl-CoA carboxylase carboxyl transferase subunit alpha